MTEIKIEGSKRIEIVLDYIKENINNYNQMHYVCFEFENGGYIMMSHKPYECVNATFECAQEGIEGYELEEYNGVEFIHCDDLGGNDWTIHYEGEYFFAND